MRLNITSVFEFMPLDQSHFMQGICLANGSTINDTMQFFKAEITKQNCLTPHFLTINDGMNKIYKIYLYIYIFIGLKTTFEIGNSNLSKT